MITTTYTFSGFWIILFFRPWLHLKVCLCAGRHLHCAIHAIKRDITSDRPPPLVSFHDRQNVLKTYDTTTFTSPQKPCARPRTGFTGNNDVTIQPIKVISNPYTCFHYQFFDIFLLIFEAQNRLTIQQEDKDLTKFWPFQGIPYFLTISFVLVTRELTLFIELIYNNA